ncbi:MAG: EamA family transporter [Bdellovibrionales bacterium]|nr:EamA family transporter [Bdellovibrionales bacterium]
MSEKQSRAWLAIAALLLVQLIFGFNYAASKVILAEFPPVLWAAVRMTTAAILMFAFSFWLVPKEMRRSDREFMLKTFIYSLFGIAFSQAFFMLGLRYTTTSNAAVLNSLTPIFTLFFAIMAKKERFTVFRGVGFIVAVAGVLVLKNVESFSMNGDTWKGDVYTLMNCASLALFFILSRDFLRKNSPFWATAWMFLWGAILLGVASIHQLDQLVPHSGMTEHLWIAILYNILLGTILTYFLNSWTLTRVNPSVVALFFYLQPVIAVLNGWLSLGETPTTRMLFAMCCIFFGVGIGSMKRNPTP